MRHENRNRVATKSSAQPVTARIMSATGIRRAVSRGGHRVDSRESGQQGLQQINGALEQAQVQLLRGSGVGHWATLKE